MKWMKQEGNRPIYTRLVSVTCTSCLLELESVTCGENLNWEARRYINDIWYLNKLRRWLVESDGNMQEGKTVMVR
jgi:hypothetical protein